MKSHEGQDIVDLYFGSLLEGGRGITDDEARRYVRGMTSTHSAQLAANGGIQFRFETVIYSTAPKNLICQYAIVRDGAIEFREDWPWFVPGSSDTLFNTFAEAVQFIHSG